MFFKNNKKSYFALAFSSQKIFLAQTDKEGKLVKKTSIDLPEGVIDRGRLKEPEHLKKLLASLIEREKIKSKFVVIGLSEIAAFVRSIDLPLLPAEDLDEAVRWQVESLLPSPLEEVYLDWMLIEKNKQSQKILVMSLPVKMVEDYARVLEEIGLQSVAFEPASLSLARLVGKEKGIKLVAQINKDKAVLVIVREQGEVGLISTVSFKDGNLDDLFSTLKGMLEFYQKKESPEKQIEKIFICGQQASQDLLTRIKQETSLETSFVSVEDIKLAPVISLAQKDVAAPQDEKTINLIPPRIQGVYDLAKKKQRLENWIKFTLFFLFLNFFAFGVSALQVYFSLKSVEGQIIKLKSSITPQMEAIETRAKIVNQKATRVLNLVDSQQEFLSLIDHVSDSASLEISINHWAFDFEKNELIINGVAKNRGKLLEFKKKLEETGQFARVRLPLSSLEKEENADFVFFLTREEKSQSGAE